MSPESAVQILTHMKTSYTLLCEDANLEKARRSQAAKRLCAIDVAIVAITRMEEVDGNKINAG